MNFDWLIEINISLLKCYLQLVIIINYKVPQGMFKNLPHFKTKCGNKNASVTFAER